MKKISVILLAFCLFLLAACDNGPAQPEPSQPHVNEDPGIDYDIMVNKLAENGESGYTIVYSADSGAAVKKAAEEIRDFVIQSAGAVISVKIDTAVNYSAGTKILSLGKTFQLGGLNLGFDYTLLKNDGFFIKTMDNGIFIDGKTDRGILYGAYDFLEKVVGVKFLAYDYTYVPESAEIPVYKMDITENPAIENRVYFNRFTMLKGQFASRLRMVNEYVEIPEAYGGNFAMFDDIPNPTHNTLYYVDPDIYYNDHPDWFFISDGKIRDLNYSKVGILPDGSIDYSLEISPVKVAIESLKNFILNSNDKYYMIGQMDYKYPCSCPDCEREAALYERSGMGIRFVNAISDGIAGWLEENVEREIFLATFAYQYSEKAPVKKRTSTEQTIEPLDPSVVPRDNVIVRIAPIKADNYYGMTEEGQTNDTLNMFNEWRAVADRFMIWSYHALFSSHFAYYPTMQHWQKDLRLYKEMNAEYVLMQSNFVEYNDWQAQMEAYIASKMMWNPELSVEALRAEFIAYYYEGIESYVTEFINNLDIQYAIFLRPGLSSSERPNTTLQGKEALLDSSLYSSVFWERQLEVLDNAQAVVDASSWSSSKKDDYTKRIDVLRLTPQFMVAYKYDSYYPGDIWGKQSFLDAFFTNCAKLEVSQWAEAYDLNSLKTRLGYTKVS